MANVYIGLGSNVGNRRAILHRAVELMNQRIGTVKALSAFYETAPEGFRSDNQFLNATCMLETDLPPSAILKQTEAIERELGRSQKSNAGRYADRTIDIDILLIDNEINANQPPVVPHPHMHERSFVLLPLCEIAPDVVHPLLAKTVRQLTIELLGSCTEK